MGLLPPMVSVAVGITTLSALSHSTACLAVPCLAPILFTVLRENPYRQVLSAAGSARGGEYLQRNCTPVLGQQASGTGSSCVTRTCRNGSVTHRGTGGWWEQSATAPTTKLNNYSRLCQQACSRVKG